jgi:hypothetical protein
MLSRRGLERPCETLVAWAREARRNKGLWDAGDLSFLSYSRARHSVPAAPTSTRPHSVSGERSTTGVHICACSLTLRTLTRADTPLFRSKPASRPTSRRKSPFFPATLRQPGARTAQCKALNRRWARASKASSHLAPADPGESRLTMSAISSSSIGTVCTPGIDWHAPGVRECPGAVVCD